MALEVHVSELRAVDKMSSVMKQIGNEGKQLGQTLSQSMNQASESSRRFNVDRAAMVGGLRELQGAFSDWSRAAAEEAAMQDRLAQSVENTGTSYDKVSTAMDAAIKHAMDLKFADDQAIQGLDRLTQTTGDATVAMDNIGLAMDIARARGISLADASTLVGRVYEGNYTQLQRMGIAIDENASSTEALALLQQRFAGQASTYAESAAGEIEGYSNMIADATENLAAHTGQLQVLLGVMPGVNALYSVFSGLIAGIGGVGALGAYGLPIAAAAGGGYLLYDVLANADRAGNNSSDSTYGSAFAGAAGLAKWATPGGFGDSLFGDIQSQFQGIIDENGVEQILTQMFWGVETEAQAKERFNQLVKTGIVPNMDMGQLQNYATGRGITIPELFGQAAQQSDMIFDPVTKQYFTSEQWIQRQSSLAGPFEGVSGRESYGSSLYADRAGAGVSPWSTALEPSASRDLVRFRRLTDQVSSELDAAVAEYLSAGVIEARDLLRDAYPDSPLRNRPLGAGSASGVGNLTPFDIQAQSAGQARSNFQTGNQVTIGQTQGMASDSQGLADFTKGLVNEAGALGKWDDLVSRGVIDLATEQWASYANVQGDANRIFAANQDIQDDTAVIQLKQLGYMADLQEEYAAQIDAISKMDEAEQRHTLAMMDSSEQAKVNEAATIAYRVATGELSSAIGTDLIKGMAQADPLFAELAEQYGLISVGADGTITVNFPEKESLIDAVGELSDNVQELIDLLADSLNLDINSNAGDEAAKLGLVVDLLNALNGKETTYYVNEVRTGVSYGSPNGPSLLPYQLGGMIPAAMHGRVMGNYTLVGEAGPELIAGGQGGLVVPASATRAMRQKGTGDGLHFHGPVSVTVVANEPRQFATALREQAVGSARQ